MKRTKITKNSLESIGFEDGIPYADFSMVISEDVIKLGSISTTVITKIQIREFENFKYVYVDIIDSLDNNIVLPREFVFIDEITQLLTSLTGKNQFYKK